MNFQAELAEKVMRGEKTVTRRMVSTNPNSPWFAINRAFRPPRAKGFEPGRDYAVCPGRGKSAIGRIRVKWVDALTLGKLGRIEAQAEGFATPEEFEAAWAKMHGGYFAGALVWRVEFKVCQCECGFGTTDKGGPTDFHALDCRFNPTLVAA